MDICCIESTESLTNQQTGTPMNIRATPLRPFTPQNHRRGSIICGPNTDLLSAIKQVASFERNGQVS